MAHGERSATVNKQEGKVIETQHMKVQNMHYRGMMC